MRKIKARTYDRILLTLDELGMSMDQAMDLPWVVERVASLRQNRLGVELELGGFAGRLFVHDNLVIEVAELVHGTTAACLALLSPAPRQGTQASGTGQLLPPQQALAVAFVSTCVQLLRRGHLREYASTTHETSRPRGKVMIGASARGPWARGRSDRLVTRRRPLTEDTPLTRLLLAASVRAERLLLHPGHSALAEARRCILALSGATLTRQHPADLGPLAEADPDVARGSRLARALLRGVPVLGADTKPKTPFTAWVNVADLFEGAIRAVCARAYLTATVTAGDEEGVTLFRQYEGDPEGSVKRAEPDIAIRHEGRTLVLDAKYRRRGENVDEESIYQIMAHADAFEADAAALVTPALNGLPDVVRLGRDSRGRSFDVLSVNAADAGAIEADVATWVRRHLTTSAPLSDTSGSA